MAKIVFCGMTLGVLENGNFKREVLRKKHFYRTVGFYAYRKDAFDYLKTFPIDRFSIVEKDTGKKYEANWSDVVENAFPLFDQVCLPKKKFEESKLL